MKEKIKPIGDKIKAFFTSMKKPVRIALIAVLVAAIAAIGILIYRYNNRPYTVLYTGMNSEDMTQVLSYLGTNGYTDFKTQGDDTILVPEDKVSALKVQLAMQGYPSSGYGYTLYMDNVSALSSQSDREQLALYQLQEKLGKDIRAFDGVTDASVYLTPGEDNRYILNEDDIINASASVEVTMEPNRVLTNQEASAIRRMVQRAYPKLAVEDVTLVDTNGNEYSDDDTIIAGDAASLKLALENKVNKSVRESILDVLAPLYGKENLSISARSNVDVSRVYTDSTNYFLPEWATEGGNPNGEGIIGTMVWDNVVVRDGDETVGGVAGTANNAELNEYVTQYTPDGTEQELGSSGEKHFNTDTTHTQREIIGGVVEDLMVAVAINSTTATTANVENLLPLIARAAGITSEQQEEKISILVAPFYVEPAEPIPPTVVPGLQVPSWMLYAFVAGLILFILLLVLILIIAHRRKKKRIAKQKAEEEARIALESQQRIILDENGQPQLVVAPTGGADIMDLHSERSLELRQEVRQFAEDNPEIAAQMIKTMLKGGGEDDGKT